MCKDKEKGGRRCSESRKRTPEEKVKRNATDKARYQRTKWAVTDLKQACAVSSAAIKSDGWNPLVGVGLDDESLPFRANLARINDFGLFTYVSQPSGQQVYLHRVWVQRAYVMGYAAPETVERLRQVAARSGFVVHTEQPNELVMTGDREETAPWAYGATAARDEGCGALAAVLNASVPVWLLAEPGSDSVFTSF
jgi:hypothetical protein